MDGKEEILDLLRENARLSVEDISAMTKKSADEVKAIIKGLEDDNAILIPKKTIERRNPRLIEREFRRRARTDAFCLFVSERRKQIKNTRKILFVAAARRGKILLANDEEGQNHRQRQVYFPERRDERAARVLDALQSTDAAATLAQRPAEDVASLERRAPRIVMTVRLNGRARVPAKGVNFVDKSDGFRRKRRGVPFVIERPNRHVDEILRAQITRRRGGEDR